MTDITDEEFDRKCRVRAVALSYDARHTIEKLDAEIERLRAENATLREAIDNLQAQAKGEWVAVPKVEWDAIMAALRGEKQP
jgi:cell division protein FtsB